MREYDLINIFSLITHPGMYLGSNRQADLEKLPTFLGAYEMGSKYECRFSELLMHQLVRKFNVYQSPGGVIHQVKEAAEIKSADWFEFFVTETKEILCEVSDSDGKNRFAKILRERVVRLLENSGSPEEVESMVMFISWRGLAKSVKDWSGVNLNANETELIFRILESTKNLEGQYSVVELPETLKNDMALLKELVEKNLKQED